MTRRVVGCAIAVLLMSALIASASGTQSTSIPITHKHLVAQCLDGSRVEPTARHVSLGPGVHSMTFTMANAPRRGMESSDPGAATIRFTVEPGHRYEIEVRASTTSYSSRVWKKGEWKPVVRDRTDEAIVSEDPGWGEEPCK